MMCALIMAGGKGERFWPLSTDEKPKQFLKLLGKKTMIQMTVERLLPLISADRIFIVTGKRYVQIVKEQLPNLPENNIIVEPVGRNTAPCIALSAFYIKKRCNDAAILVIPSDHLVVDENRFRNTIAYGADFIQNNISAVVTLGIKPDRPETGYGYIQFTVSNSQCIFNEAAVTTEEDFNVFKVEKFVEKPDVDTAKKYIKEGNFLWNGGMFIWKCSTILKLTKRYLNNTYDILKGVFEKDDKNFSRLLEEKYPGVDNISVDYGIMERTENIYVIPSDFGWDDIGTWHAVERYREKDNNNNVCMGDIRSLGSSNNIVYSENKPIVIVGLEDVFVVESDDIIFVGKKEDIERIKEIKKNVSREDISK
ncbi:mannose-1-phosphate guanylyltransferase [Clostridium sp. HV4-5-A1G]|uniref:mannose-1-phosphate guanylyltransferase n=1 Tax=Clostridium sp. HV4-5-A1G TaxID=2004595 RepID=UPI00123B7CA5|nr:mannose-1-phosphate guanylyltransferase [Clostridium sp. HV4-5-A1G]KAA8665323.1 mannose-1-phosphate guanylyltransferase [Clostridium sp. HV4-5-A1G]